MSEKHFELWLAVKIVEENFPITHPEIFLHDACREILRLNEENNRLKLECNNLYEEMGRPRRYVQCPECE